MNYYLVKTKCGHVGSNKYIEKTFAICSDTKSNAAKFAKRLPRVKKHLKDAIISVKEVDYIEYINQIEENKIDVYLNAYTKKDILQILDSDLIYSFSNKKHYKSSLEFESREEKVKFKIKKTFQKEVSMYEYAY